MMKQTSLYESVVGQPLRGPLDVPLQMYNVLTNQQLTSEEFAMQDDELYAKSLASAGVDPKVHGFARPNTPMTRTDGERIALMCELVELSQPEISPECVSPLFDWPMYVRVMAALGTRPQGGRALLLGAQSALSARTFQAMATEEFGVEEAHVIDIKAGADKQKFGTFTYADARALPFADGTFDIVQSSELLNHMRDAQGARINPHEGMQRVFPEAVRVLRPGGQLLLRESVRMNNPERPIDSVEAARQRLARDQQYYIAALANAGAGQVAVSPFLRPPELSYLFDPARRYDMTGWTPVLGTYAIHAIK